MRRIDMTNMQLIHHGSAWQHEGSPCDKSMISKLERNENLVYWLQVCTFAVCLASVDCIYCNVFVVFIVAQGCSYYCSDSSAAHR